MKSIKLSFQLSILPIISLQILMIDEQKKLIPYHYKHYGFQAVKEMFISKERIPGKLKKPKEVDWKAVPSFGEVRDL